MDINTVPQVLGFVTGIILAILPIFNLVVITFLIKDIKELKNNRKMDNYEHRPKKNISE